MKTNRKITILGAGNVGASVAYTLTLDGLASEIVLVDINKDKAIGEALDIQQGLSFARPVNIYAGDYSDAADSDIVVVTSGIPRKPGQTRIDLVNNNVSLIREMIPEVVKYAPNAIYVVVSNPVDILTYEIIKCSGLPANRVIGSGTVLDTSRFRANLAERLDLTAKNVHAYVLGEHGDTSVMPWSRVSVSGIPIMDYCKEMDVDLDLTDKNVRVGIEDEVRKAGGKVIKCKGSTHYAIAMSVKYLCEIILRNTHSIITVSGLMQGEYGLEDVCLSIPYIVDLQGIRQPVPVTLTEEEHGQLTASADALKTVIAQIS